MDIWEKLCALAAKEYRPGDLSPFIWAHNVVCALETESGKIFTGFCMEGASGVINLCAERTAAVNMIANCGETRVKRLVVFRDVPPCRELDARNFLPCGACREFFLQLDIKNKDMQILTDLKTRAVITLGELMPHWWGENRYLGGNT